MNRATTVTPLIVEKKQSEYRFRIAAHYHDGQLTAIEEIPESLAKTDSAAAIYATKSPAFTGIEL